MVLQMRPQVAVLTGGGDRPYALGLAMSLATAGVNLDFVGSNELESAELGLQPTVRFLNLRGDMNPDVPLMMKLMRLARYYARLLAYACRSKAPVFHILWNNKIEWFDRTLLLAFYKLLGKRLAFTVHNVNIGVRDGRDGFWNRWTLRLQYRLVDHLFVHTQLMLQQLRDEFGVPPEKISIIPFGINSTVPDTPLTREQARSRLDLEPTDRVLLFFGNIAPYKGLEYLVEATALVLKSMPDAKLVIAGRPKGHVEYWRGIERSLGRPEFALRLVQRIEYVPDEETEVYFKAADVLVLPYREIYQSGVLFLGYNFGIPVIATDIGSLRDDIVEGETGYWGAPGDADALRSAIERFFSSALYREASVRREEIRRFARARYSWATVADITKRVYSQLSHAR